MSTEVRNKTGFRYARFASAVIDLTSFAFFVVIGNRALSQELDTESPLVSLDFWGMIGILIGVLFWVAIWYMRRAGDDA